MCWLININFQEFHAFDLPFLLFMLMMKMNMREGERERENIKTNIYHPTKGACFISVTIPFGVSIWRIRFVGLIIILKKDLLLVLLFHKSILWNLFYWVIFKRAFRFLIF
jgi:hypothetical protein